MKLKRVINLLLLGSIVFIFGRQVWENRHDYQEKFDPSYWQYRYEHSQWTISYKTEEKQRVIDIGDDGLYAYAGWQYINGIDPTSINPEMPPSGKYLIGLVIKIFGNQGIFGILTSISALVAVYLLGRRVLGNGVLGLLGVLGILREPLFLQQLRAPFLDNLYLTFLALVFYLFLNKKYLLMGLFLGALWATKSTILGGAVAMTLFAWMIWARREYLGKWGLGLVVAVGVFLLSYGVYFANGHNLGEFLALQKWIANFYARGAQAPLFSVFPMLLLGQWPVWWTSVYQKIGEWSLWWTAATVMGIMGGLMALMERKNKETTLLLIWIVVYLAILSVIPVYPRYFLALLPFLYILVIKFFIDLPYGRILGFWNRHFWAICIFGVIGILGTWLRTAGILDYFTAFTYDVGRDLLAARDIVFYRDIPLIGPTSGIIGLNYGPWWYWFLSLPMALGGGDPRWPGLFIAGGGMVTVALAYCFGWRLGGAKVGLISMGLFAFAHNFIGTSAQIWNPNLVIPGAMLLVVVLCGLGAGREKIKDGQGKRNLFKWLLVGVLLGWIMEMEMALGLVLIPVFFAGIIKGLKGSRGLSFLGILGGITIMEVPRLLFYIRHRFNPLPFMAEYFQNSGAVERYTKSFTERLLDRSQIFWWHWQETFNFWPILEFVLLVLMVFLLIKFWRKFKDTEQWMVKFILFLIFGLWLGFSIYPASVWQYYLCILPVFYLTLVVMIFNVWQKETKKPWALILGSLIVIALLNPIGQIKNILSKEKTIGDAAVLRNQLKVMDYVYRESEKQRFNVVAYTPPLIDYTWQYLWWWYGQNKYGVLPSEWTTEKLFWIMEPDYEVPGRLEMWKEIRKEDGKFYKEEEVVAGIRVQQRKRIP